MATLSPVTICNEALLFLGESVIISLDEETENGSLCNQFYERVRDSELASHPWNFAIKRASLSRLVDAPAYEFKYQFSAPADTLRILEVWPKECEWIREVASDNTQVILTDHSTLSCRYIYRNTDAQSYSEAFASVLSARLAFILSETLTGRTSKREAAVGWYSDILTKARINDSQEHGVTRLRDTSVVDARDINAGIDPSVRSINLT